MVTAKLRTAVSAVALVAAVIAIVMEIGFGSRHAIGRPAGSTSKASAEARIAGHLSDSPASVAAPMHERVIGTPMQLGGVPVPFSPALVTITNLYFDSKPVIAVYAGADVATPRQGEVMVWRATGQMDCYRLPTARGIAHLVSLSGSRLTVADAAGDTYVFDPTSGNWLTR